MEYIQEVLVYKTTSTLVVDSCILISCTGCSRSEAYIVPCKTGVEKQTYGILKINIKRL